MFRHVQMAVNQRTVENYVPLQCKRALYLDLFGVRIQLASVVERYTCTLVNAKELEQHWRSRSHQFPKYYRQGIKPHKGSSSQSFKDKNLWRECLHKLLSDNDIDVVLEQETHAENDEQLCSRGNILDFCLLCSTFPHFYGSAT